MTDERLREILDELEHWEGRESRLYLDARENPTIGVGCLIPSCVAYWALPMRVGDRAATEEEKQEDYLRVRSMPRGLGARAYRAHPPELDLYLADEAIDELAFRRLHTACAGLRGLCPGFDGFPTAAQTCLIDLAWNLGLGKLRDEFPRLIGACNRGDWRTAAIESHVSSSRAARNEWRAKCFFDAAMAAVVA